MRDKLIKKSWCFAIILLFVGIGVLPSLTVNVSAAEVSLPFFDDFENIASGTYPSANGWKNMYSGYTSYVSTAESYSGSKSFCLKARSNWARTDYVQISPPEKLIYECYVKVMDSSRGTTVGFTIARGAYNPRFNCIQFANNGKIYFRKDVWGAPSTEIQSYSAQTWYKVRVDLDYSDETADVYINDVLKQQGLEIYPRDFNHNKWGHVVLNKFSLALNNFAGGETSVVYFDDVKLTSVIEVDIDIKPGSYPNSINPKSKGKVPVAVLTTDDFNASTIDPDTVIFLDATPVQWATEDVDNDSDIDMIFHFKTQELDFDMLVDEGGEEYPYAYLTGETFDVQLFEGKDTVRLVGHLQMLLETFIVRFMQIIERFMYIFGILPN